MMINYLPGSLTKKTNTTNQHFQSQRKTSERFLQITKESTLVLSRKLVSAPFLFPFFLSTIKKLIYFICTKTAEAKARKKMKAQKKIEKVKSKATSIANDNELSETAKARQIEKLYKSQMAKMKTKQVYVVRRKFQKGLQRIGPKREIGTKVRIVDKRMRKDRRAEKAAGKRNK